ncbi:alpha/beta hydrolase [Catenovulum maritimum]|uniref:BD-FAE-like domain-containing protein n=1 Tax=Catenovulum maritimum TaxID=1513271 RepID=A0A0J8GRG1_9ALTE|nr:alpha/beta hydrolase [Catenovulum maritimum]KMT65410.1 hypothetical protein XM47_08585 [Catenovulum maritimum]
MIKIFQLANLATVLTALCLNAFAYEVNDSYTVSQRYEKYKKLQPDLVLPKLELNQGAQMYFDLRYAKEGKRELHLDIFRPASKSNELKPAIVLIHGGGWMSGNKSHMYGLAIKLANMGYVTIPVEYRLSPESTYPTGLRDINRAISWVKQNAHSYNINPKLVAIAGGSSGGQMAALLATTSQTGLYKNDTDNTDLFAVIVLDGVIDFTDPLALLYENKKAGHSAAALWLGGSYQELPHIWRQASALTHVSNKTPAMLYLSSGQLRFQAGRENLFKALDKFKIAHKTYFYNDVIHTFWLFEPWLSDSVGKIDQFLQQQISLIKGS